MKLLLFVFCSLFISVASFASTFSECVDFVFKSPSVQTEQEARDHCHRVQSMSCVRWAFHNQNPMQTPEDAAESCKNIFSMDCVTWVYKSHTIQEKEEALHACKFVKLFPCVEWVFESHTIHTNEDERP
jgi:hypothetical protein